MQYGLDPVANFAIGQLASGMLASATTFTLVTGQGALFPDPATLGSYNVTIWNSTDYANPSDDPTKIIFRVTAKSSDDFTGSSSQEGGGAYAQNTADKVYKVSLGVTAKTITDIETLGYTGMSNNAILNPEAYSWTNFINSTGVTNPGYDTGTADNWMTIYTTDGGTLPTTIIHRRSTLTAGEAYPLYYAYETNYNGAGSGFGTNSYYCQYQKVENGVRKLCGNGKYITLSFWAKSSVANKKIGVVINQIYGTGGSPTGTEVLTGTAITLNSTLTRYSVTFPTNTLVGKTFGTNNDDYLQVIICHQWGATFGAFLGTGVAESFVGSGSTYITGVQLNAGQFPFLYSPRRYKEDDFLSTWDYYPSSITRVANNYSPEYSDHQQYHIESDGTLAAIFLTCNGQVRYRNGTAQFILALSIWASATLVKAIIKDRYIYALLTQTATESRIYRCSIDSDINSAGNWAQLTISGTALGTTTAEGIVGYAAGQFWVAKSGVGFVPYTLSGTTLTSGSTVTVTGATYSYTSVINEDGIYVCGWGAAPYIRYASLAGVLDANRQIRSSTGSYLFAYPKAFYVSSSVSSDLFRTKV